MRGAGLEREPRARGGATGVPARRSLHPADATISVLATRHEPSQSARPVAPCWIAEDTPEPQERKSEPCVVVEVAPIARDREVRVAGPQPAERIVERADRRIATERAGLRRGPEDVRERPGGRRPAAGPVEHADASPPGSKGVAKERRPRVERELRPHRSVEVDRDRALFAPLPVTQRFRETHDQRGASEELERTDQRVSAQAGDPEDRRSRKDDRAGKDATHAPPRRRGKEARDLTRLDLDAIADPVDGAHLPRGTVRHGLSLPICG